MKHRHDHERGFAGRVVACTDLRCEPELDANILVGELYAFGQPCRAGRIKQDNIVIWPGGELWIAAGSATPPSLVIHEGLFAPAKNNNVADRRTLRGSDTGCVQKQGISEKHA